MLCCVGLLSSIYISPKIFWANKDPSRYYQNPEIARIINESSNSLIISDAVWDQIMTLSYRISSDVKYQLVTQYDNQKIPDNFSHYFLYKPSRDLQNQFKQNRNYQIKSAYQGDDSWLWIIQKTDVN